MRLPKPPRMTAADRSFCQKYAAFKRRLTRAKVQDVFGVVSASGTACGGEPPDCCFIFHCAAWKTRDLPVRTDELRVELPTSEKRAMELMDAVGEYDIVHFRARVEQMPRGSMFAKAVRIVALSIVDSELAAHVNRLQRPVIMRDAKLGSFALDRSVNRFRGKCTWGGKKVDLSLEVEDDAVDRAGEQLLTMHALKRSERLWKSRVTKYLLQHLMPLYNDSWRQSEDPRLSAAAFLKKVEHQAISIGTEGRFEFDFHDDVELFGGHSIVIRGSLTKGIRDYDLQG